MLLECPFFIHHQFPPSKGSILLVARHSWRIRTCPNQKVLSGTQGVPSTRPNFHTTFPKQASDKAHHIVPIILRNKFPFTHCRNWNPNNPEISHNHLPRSHPLPRPLPELDCHIVTLTPTRLGLSRIHTGAGDRPSYNGTGVTLQRPMVQGEEEDFKF